MKSTIIDETMLSITCILIVAKHPARVVDACGVGVKSTPSAQIMERTSVARLPRLVRTAAVQRKQTIWFRSRWLVQKWVPSKAKARAAKGM